MMKHLDDETGRQEGPSMQRLEADLSHVLREVRMGQPIAVERNGKRYRTFRFAEHLCDTLWDSQDRFNLPHDKRPVLSIPNRSLLGGGIHAGYDHTTNVVHISQDALLHITKYPYQLGDIIGEELFGHCYRYHRLYPYGGGPQKNLAFGGKVERGDVEEFFGYLGRKFLYAEHGSVFSLFPRGSVTQPKDITVVDEEIESLRVRLQGWLEPKKGDIRKEIETKEGHKTGYKWAYMFQICGIPQTSVDALYSLPTNEVVSRFFRHDQDLRTIGSR